MRYWLAWIVLPACTASELDEVVPPSPVSTARCAWSGQPLEAVSLGGDSQVIGDVTGDGIDDWLQVGGVDRVIVAGPFPGTPWATLVADGDSFVRASVGELGGGPGPDLVIARHWRSHVAVFFGPIAQGAALDVASASVSISSPLEGLSDLFGYARVIADVTGDGVADLIVGAPAEGEEACFGTLDIAVYPGPIMPGSTTRGAAPLHLSAPSGSCLGNVMQLAELDGAPGDELFVAGQNATQGYSLPLSTAPPTSYASGYYPVGAQDLDDDGRADVVLESGALLMASGARSELEVDPTVHVRALPPVGWSDAGALVYESRTPALRLMVPGATRIGELPLVAAGDHQGFASAGDLDADGELDLVVGDQWLRCR